MTSAEQNREHKRASTHVPHAGLRRLGKYELIARIGKGGMAQVYLARQRGLMDFEKIVVVKTIHPHLAEQQGFIDMLLDEARIAARIEHPCVVDIYDLGIEDDTYFIAMEHLAGLSLVRVLRAGVEKRPLDVRSRVRIIADVADGLHAAHELKDRSGRSLEVIHRDVTPGNIVVQYSGRVKIVDFGIAKARGRIAEDTGLRRWKGKLNYMAPEHVTGKPIDRRVDIFSLGVVMWESLALRRLFRYKSAVDMAEAIVEQEIIPPSRIRSDVPPKLDSIVLRALERDPDKRYATCAELLDDLEKFLSAAAFRPQHNVIAKYMQEIFADEIAEREVLLREVAAATTEIKVALARSNDLDDPLDALPADSGSGTPSGDHDDQLAAGASSTGTGSGSNPSISIEAESSESGPDNEGEGDSDGDAGVAGVATPLGSSDLAASAVQQARAASVADAESAMIPVRLDTEAQRFVDKRKQRRAIVVTGFLAVFVLVIVIAATRGGSKQARNDPAGKLANPIPTMTDSDDQALHPPEAPDQAGNGVASGQAGTARVEQQTGQAVENSANTGQNTGDEGSTSGEEIAGDASVEPTLVADTVDTDAASDDQTGEETTSDDGSSKSRPTAPRASASELNRQGIDYFVKGKLSQAREKFRASLRVNPRYAQAHKGLGLVYERMGNKKQAAKAYREYLRLAPKASDAEAIRRRLASFGG